VIVSSSDRLSLIDELFRNYDALARRYFGTVAAEAKADGTAVTRLDKEASALVVAALRHHTPGYGIISEEEARSHLPDAEWQWVIDPVDGTASFARGYPTWGLGIGLMRGDVPVEGYLRFPMLGETFCFSGGVGTLNGVPLSPTPPKPLPDTYNVLTTSTLHRQLPFDRLAEFKLRNMGSNLYHLASLAAGRADSMICPPAYLWDVAGGLPFTRAMGMIEVCVDGSPFRLRDVMRAPGYAMAQPVLIGRPAEVERLHRALS
jgi:fructose-1,6-bisphosphatase/inositol monophosphatase family enzyme